MDHSDTGHERLVRIEQAVGSLPRIEREIFLARRLDSMSYADIASRTGLSERQVVRALSRALRRFDRAMSRH